MTTLMIMPGLTLLYAFGALLLIGYGLYYYKLFNQKGIAPRLFPLIFGLIAAACFAFLWFSFHPPSGSSTFSNLDHHFIRHQGYQVTGKVVLGRSDTTSNHIAPYSAFVIQKENGNIRVQATWTESPFYISENGKQQLLSKSWPALQHAVLFMEDSNRIELRSTAAEQYILTINGSRVASVNRTIRRGITAWQLFRDDTLYMKTEWYGREAIAEGLQQIMLLNDSFSADKNGRIVYFLSARLFSIASAVQYDQQPLLLKSTAFSHALNDRSLIGWGIGFPEKNKNQFYIHQLGADSFRLVNRYPVAYPLTEEQTQFESGYPVIKFLAASNRQAGELPGILQEGFVFNAFGEDSSCRFSPVLLQYQKRRPGEPVQLQISNTNTHTTAPLLQQNHFLLSSEQPGLAWEFAISNSFQWKLGNTYWQPLHWQLAIFGSLFFFCMIVLFTAIRPSTSSQGWVWQLLACLLMIFLTTRFFLYWRYKSFPPYEGMDLPSLQQLNSFWNFGILILVTFLLALVFGVSTFKNLYSKIRSFTGRKKSYKSENGFQSAPDNWLLSRAWVKRKGIKSIFWISWSFILACAALTAFLSDFSPATCRHLSILLILLYFFFSWFATTRSPLLSAVTFSWWKIDTNKPLHLLISNPVRLLLSLSLLGLFAFIDIGFALVFINFLLFHEAFHFINCSIAGLSAGSRKNATLFGCLAFLYAGLFIFNLLYGPFVFRYLLALPNWCFGLGYFLISSVLVYAAVRLLDFTPFKKKMTQVLVPAALSILAFLFIPREMIQKKAAMTRYRIDVLTMPAEAAIEKAYRNGDGYEPVIRAAQNQWFINTFIDEENNPASNKAGFHLLPHAPQNRGAKYNAQATDLVTSRFFIAEHGRWSALLYVLLLLLPVSLLASFYKLYPDFTNRINPGYAAAGTGFAILNYLLVTALLVILAATGRYVFFGQDLPFGSILSKQSILFPALLLMAVVLVFRNIPLQRYPNRRKLLPGALVFAGLFVLLFFIHPPYNRTKDFGVTGLAEQAESYLASVVQPIWDDIDTAKGTSKYNLQQKDQLFAAKLKELDASGRFSDAPAFLQAQIRDYALSGLNTHLDANQMLFLSMHSGRPKLTMNAGFFHVEAPPHLQQLWRGSIFGDTSTCQISTYHPDKAVLHQYRISAFGSDSSFMTSDSLQIFYQPLRPPQKGRGLFLVNQSAATVKLVSANGSLTAGPQDTLSIPNPSRFRVLFGHHRAEGQLSLQPDAFMRNFYVNGSRCYYYPLGADFIWARNLAEGVTAHYKGKDKNNRHLFLSLDPSLTASMVKAIRQMTDQDSAYTNGAAYAICIADGNGRIWAMPDHIRGFQRPDPNDKTAFRMALSGKEGRISQTELRKLNGNLNLLRLNPGPGSTLKPIVFAAIASQLPLQWNQFASTGFSEKQSFFGGEKVADYDFEKNNGTISSVSDYIRYSDNYYHSNLLLLGSYSKQNLQALLLNNFSRNKPNGALHWPWFSYRGSSYWLNGFEQWPGYRSGKADFGSDSSFVSLGLWTNFGIHTKPATRGYDPFTAAWDSAILGPSLHRSGFILPENALFDQQSVGMHKDRPNELFMSAFRGHVKGSSQVMMPPLKMLDVFGKLVSQNRDFRLSLNPEAEEGTFTAFMTDSSLRYNDYLSLMKESVFEGMKQALFNGTAAQLGKLLTNGKPFYYYAKTGTTGDDELKTKSKLFTIIISQKEISDPGFNFRANRFVVIYFTSQNGPAKQNEAFQAEMIKMIEQSDTFRKYMEEGL